MGWAEESCIAWSASKPEQGEKPVDKLDKGQQSPQPAKGTGARKNWTQTYPFRYRWTATATEQYPIPNSFPPIKKTTNS